MTENRKLYVKFSNKRVNAAKEKIEFKLTYPEFLNLATQAGITSSDMHIKGYHLARYKDQGGYEVGNCRFVFYKENYKEKVVSYKSRATAAMNIKRYMDNLTPEQRVDHYKNIARSKQRKGYKRPLGIGALSQEVINKRHEIIKSVAPGFGFLTRVSPLIQMTPQSVGRFLRKYPITAL